MKAALAILVALLGFAGLAEAQAAPKRIYLAPDDHTDYMWSGNEEDYRQAFLQMIDYYLNLADTTQNQSSVYQSRWNMDGTFWAWVYQKNRTAAQFERLLGRLRDGHFSIPLNALVSCYGAQPAEAVLRGMYYAGKLERQYGVPIVMAGSMENQTLPYGLVALWSGAGAQYTWKGICGCATNVPSAGDREHEIYWWVGPDGSRILTKWNSMLQDNQSIGGYAEAYDPAGVVDFVDANPQFLALYPYRVIGAFGKGWDNLKTLTSEFPATAKAETTAARQVIVSNERDFFDDFKASYGGSLPTMACSYGNEWDLYCASLAEVSARVKRAVEKLRGAEALATLASLQDPSFMTGRQSARDQAWMDLGLYWEHNWTADGNVVSRSARAAWQRKLAGEIESYVNGLQADAAAALGGMIRRQGSLTRFYVFNPLGWTRTDLADLPYSAAAPVHVVDLDSGDEVPSQIVTVDGVRCLRVLATAVPSAGYKVFEIQPGAGANFPGAPTASGSVLENEFYKLTVASRGAITSLLDKGRSNREFARTVSGRALNDLGAGSGSLNVENAGPVSATLLATSPDPLQHTTRITLVRGLRRIDIRDEIEQNFSAVTTWGFGFALTSPDVWHEEVGALVRARLLAAGGQYSPRNARYDWLTLNHFADISGQGSVGVTLSNADCSFMRLGNSTVGSLDTATALLSPLAGGQVDGPTLGIPNQGGDTHFLQRFALTTHGAFSPADAMRFALEHQNPLLTGLVRGGTAYPETAFSLLTIDNPNVLLWALKPPEDDIKNGIIARLWNFSASPASVALATSPQTIYEAQRLSHIETVLGSASVAGGVLTAQMTAQQLQTYLLVLRGTSAGRGLFKDE